MAILSDAILDKFRSRAETYDRENRFPFEDFEELRKVGYLAALVPTKFGGKGLSLQEVVEEQKRLAAASSATALAVNMHLIWTGVALVLNRQNDHSLDFVLEEAARGELFALAISEAGNDLVLFGSRTEAVPLGDGGYEFTGTKIFTSLSPAWSRLAIFGLDSTSPDAPKLVHAVIERDAEGIQILDDWDTLGMRATSSNTTKLSKVRAPAERVHRRLEPGPSSDPLIFAIFANFEILLASVYTGIAVRAVELAVESARARTSSKAGGAPKSSDPDVRRRIAGAAMVLDGIHPQLEKIASQVDAGVDLGGSWFRALVGLKVRAVSAAQQVVGECVRASGGGAYFNRSELSRLYRDVLAGSFQPSNEDSAISTIALDILGPA